MPIKSSPFSGVKLSGDDAERFIRHMQEDKPNPAALASLERGREVLAKMKRGETFSLRRKDNDACF